MHIHRLCAVGLVCLASVTITVAADPNLGNLSWADLETCGPSTIYDGTPVEELSLGSLGSEELFW